MNDDEFKEMLHKYRDISACLLHFIPCIEYLIDSVHCRAITDILHKSNARWERVKATPRLGSMLPDETGIYMFVWKPELAFRFDNTPVSEQMSWILYVGKAGTEDSTTATIKNRYLSEYAKYVGQNGSCLWDRDVPEDRADLLARFLTLRALEFWYLPLKNSADISLLERKLIRMLRPPLNKQHGGRLRAGRPEPA